MSTTARRDSARIRLDRHEIEWLLAMIKVRTNAMAKTGSEAAAVHLEIAQEITPRLQRGLKNIDARRRREHDSAHT